MESIMSVRQIAATGKHQIDGPPRLISSRCGANHTPAQVSLQQLSGVTSIPKTGDRGKMQQDIVKKTEDFSVIEQVVMQGDLSRLSPEQRVTYYRKVCESSGLNPFTNPFAYILLNGKLTLYAKKDCTEQLRKINGVSIDELTDKLIDDIYIVTAKAKDKNGRVDQAKGAVVIGHLKGEAKANAIMKAETKAKRRVTLSICGMGWTDESEIESIPNARPVDIDLSTGEIKNPVEVLAPAPIIETPKEPMSADHIEEIKMILDDCEKTYQKWVYDYVKKTFNGFDLVPADMYDRMKTAALKNRDEHQKKILAEENIELLAAGSQ
jgi:hypothetical protein